jgi:hypothetical protein
VLGVSGRLRLEQRVEIRNGVGYFGRVRANPESTTGCPCASQPPSPGRGAESIQGARLVAGTGPANAVSRNPSYPDAKVLKIMKFAQARETRLPGGAPTPARATIWQSASPAKAIGTFRRYNRQVDNRQDEIRPCNPPT